MFDHAACRADVRQAKGKPERFPATSLLLGSSFTTDEHGPCFLLVIRSEMPARSLARSLSFVAEMLDALHRPIRKRSVMRDCRRRAWGLRFK